MPNDNHGDVVANRQARQRIHSWANFRGLVGVCTFAEVGLKRVQYYNIDVVLFYRLIERRYISE
jgi:hypothetical protein